MACENGVKRNSSGGWWTLLHKGMFNAVRQAEELCFAQDNLADELCPTTSADRYHGRLLSDLDLGAAPPCLR